MFRPQNNKDRVLHRLKVARGQLDKVISMVGEDKYCLDVLHQNRAVEAALKQADNVIMENHLRTCAAEDLQNGKEKDIVEEIMKVFAKK
jgi:CsoR family transcriptional regulator, copper-sensing transcriptional repressor